MTKQEYIKAHPKSYLAEALADNDWPNDTKIIVIGGLNTPKDKRSNLYKALQICESDEYELGGHRQRGTEGWWIAVMDNSAKEMS